MLPIDKFWLDREMRNNPELEPEVDPAEVDLDSLPKCPVCGYILYKLTGPRCPECGNAARAADLVSSPTRLEVERVARAQRWRSWVGVALVILGLAGIVAGTWGSRSAFACFFVPVAFVSVAALGYQLIFGDEKHGTVLMLGFLWLVTGLFLCAARWL